jgi:hypothetical protein
MAMAMRDQFLQPKGKQVIPRRIIKEDNLIDSVQKLYDLLGGNAMGREGDTAWLFGLPFNSKALEQAENKEGEEAEAPGLFAKGKAGLIKGSSGPGKVKAEADGTGSVEFPEPASSFTNDTPGLIQGSGEDGFVSSQVGFGYVNGFWKPSGSASQYLNGAGSAVSLLRGKTVIQNGDNSPVALGVASKLYDITLSQAYGSAVQLYLDASLFSVGDSFHFRVNAPNPMELRIYERYGNQSLNQLKMYSFSGNAVVVLAATVHRPSLYNRIDILEVRG